jgi:predicted aconitase
MARVRISTTVDSNLLDAAQRGRRLRSSELVEEALRALVNQHERIEVDASYEAYDYHPLEEPDEWGDLESWHSAARGALGAG